MHAQNQGKLFSVCLQRFSFIFETIICTYTRTVGPKMYENRCKQKNEQIQVMGTLYRCISFTAV